MMSLEGFWKQKYQTLQLQIQPKIPGNSVLFTAMTA